MTGVTQLKNVGATTATATAAVARFNYDVHYIMFSRIATTASRCSTARRFLSSEAVATANKVSLTLSLPHETLYEKAEVHSVIIPGSAGEYGVTAGHVAYVAQLKPGVLQILHEEGSAEPEKYFVAGGYALTHEDSSTVRPCFVGKHFI